ncbi:hypothetical protein Rt10032_c18g5980 [Rhodotorula toruloides]|uniref:Uncharacterized protein n=1 Tax=Rhodotorula toruloides TaxID=5286 RepID=A0A511KNK7_RHOTO|nr:hypothetical protein Rt10032_c18g5980 [Rhodotorula toruloides]
MPSTDPLLRQIQSPLERLSLHDQSGSSLTVSAGTLRSLSAESDPTFARFDANSTAFTQLEATQTLISKRTSSASSTVIFDEVDEMSEWEVVNEIARLEVKLAALRERQRCLAQVKGASGSSQEE